MADGPMTFEQYVKDYPGNNFFVLGPTNPVRKLAFKISFSKVSTFKEISKNVFSNFERLISIKFCVISEKNREILICVKFNTLQYYMFKVK